MVCIEPLFSPDHLHREQPSDEFQREFIMYSRETIRKILNGNDPRLLLIVGPCSIHDIIAAKEYATKLKQLATQVASHFFIVMRTHFEKPRTATGWKGMVYDPHLNGSHDIASGLRRSRQLLLDLASLKVPTATEFLDPIIPHYYGDLISWGSIGARTAASQIHRQFVSGLSMPIGFKNGTDGDLSVAFNAIASSSKPHAFIGLNPSGQASIIHTRGNPDVHLVLRGGHSKPNYDPGSLGTILEQMSHSHLPPCLVIDCSHDNSNRKHENQLPVFQSVIHQFLAGNNKIKGMMLESHLQAGNQDFPTSPSLLKYAISLTDPCIDWNTTEQLIMWGHSKLSQAPSSIIKQPDPLHAPQFIHQ